VAEYLTGNSPFRFVLQAGAHFLRIVGNGLLQDIAAGPLERLAVGGLADGSLSTARKVLPIFS
jgi:hypothetical protein